jgi:DNA repair exonuclease SbcCD nuclease subunit
MKKLPCICHLGDIHIFQKKRHQEVKELVGKLTELIVKEKVDIVYIGGDVVDSKARLTPEQVETTTYFFQTISQFCPIILIPGNHDIDLKQKGSLDSLTPIVDTINSVNPIYYFKDSGIYNVYGIDWCVWSCIDNKNPFDIDSPTSYTVGCYHGPIKGCVTDSGWNLESSVTLDTFDRCKTVFLNDIHLRQSFRDGDIAYSGSWYQTKIDEEVNKGVLIWQWNKDLNKYTSTFHKLNNQYGFITYEINDLDTWKLKDIPSTDKYIIRLLYTGKEEEFSAIKLLELRKKIKTEYTNNVIVQKRFKKSVKTEETRQKVGIITDFLTEYYKREKCTTKEIEHLKTIDEIYNKLVDLADYQVGEYFIEEVEINNFLCYGENNIVNLSTMPGLIGLLAPNKVGKSSFLEAIAFCLFNKAPKGSSSLIKLVNDQMPDGTKASVQVKLIINGSNWRIKRSIIPSSTGPKVKLEVYEVVGGKEIERHEESRPQTDTKVLRKLLGDEEVFLTTVLCTAKNLAEFASQRNSDRLDLVIKFLGITVYDQKHKLCDEDLKKALYLHDEHKTSLEKLTSIEELKVKKVTLIEKLKKVGEQEEEKQREIDTHNEWNRELEEKIKKLNIIGVSKTLNELTTELKDIVEEGRVKSETLTSQREKISIILTSWEESNILAWKKDTIKFKNNKTLIVENNVAIKSLKLQLASEVCPTCNQKWNEVDIIEVTKQVENLTKENKRLQEEEENWNTLQVNLSRKQTEYMTLLTQIELGESKLELNINKKENITQQIKIVEDNKIKLDKRDVYESKIKHNKEQISLLQKEKETFTSNKLYHNKELLSVKSDIETYNKKLALVIEQEERVKELRLYKKGVHRTGIPSLILETYIPTINSEINSQINDLYELNVNFELTDNTLDICFYYDEFYNDGKGKRDITQASGMEGVVINLAIRAALTKISLLPKPSLWLLDEVFSPLDIIQIEHIKPYLQRLKDQYQNIIIISHQEEVKDLPDYFINLEKNNGITSILS